MSDSLARFSTQHRATLDGYYKGEQERLQDVMTQAPRPQDRDLLEQAIEGSEDARLESRNAFNELDSLVSTLKQAMGAKGAAASCEELQCGAHAFCKQEAPRQAQCLCKAGFEGDGFVCKIPLELVEQPLLLAQSHEGTAHRIADLHVSTLMGNAVAVVFRDTSESNRGYVMFGKAGHAEVSWSEPVAFSNGSQAFAPAIVELQGGGGFVIAYRDQNRGGEGFLLSGRRDNLTGAVSFGLPRLFAHRQAQAASLVALPSKRVAVVFAEHPLAGSAMFGSAVLASASDSTAQPELLGKYRFASGPVARISVTMLSPKSFVVGYRRGERLAGGRPAEASCTVAQLHDAQLMFTSHSLNLEAGRTQIWARSVAQIRDNVFAYTYHSGGEQLTKQAILRLDPETHSLKLLREPEVLARGFTPYVGSASIENPISEQQTPEQLAMLQRQSAKLFTYYSGAGSARAQARICKAAANGIPSACKDISLSKREVVSAASAPLGDGRLLVAFTDSRGIPYYELVGLMEPEPLDPSERAG